MAETIFEDVFRNIPTPIIIDILARLPPKAVIRFRCVCKAWLKIISEPEFVNLHLSKSPTGLILVKSCPPWYEIPYPASFSLVEVDDETDHHAVRPIAGKDSEIPFSQGQNNCTTLIGSIDGLICINEFSPYRCQYFDLIHVYNPIMREFITVQPPGGEKASTYGFGISSGKYLVVRIYQEIVNPYVSLCHVYTIGGGVWKSIGHAPYLYRRSEQGLFFNGNLHWALKWNKNCQDRISCLDLGKELFHPFPSPPELSQHITPTLNVYKGCLSVCNTNPGSDLVIWVMNEYGVQNSWTKEVIISKHLIFNNIQSYDEFIIYIIKVFNDGEILLLWKFYDMLFSYDPKKMKIMQDVKKSMIDSTNKDPSYGRIEATEYVPSFVSLKSMGEVNVYRC